MALRLTRVTIVLLMAIVVVAAIPARSQAEDKDSAEKLTPAMLADRIEAAMGQYDSIEYAAKYTHPHNLKSLKPREDPVWIEAEGRYSYRTDGRRWRFEETGESVSANPRSGEASLHSHYRVSGFDGNVTYRADDIVAWIGEKARQVDRRHPRNLLWPCSAQTETMGRNRVETTQTFLDALRKPQARIIGTEKIGDRECIRVEVEWRNNAQVAPLRPFEATISPEQSYLPLTTVWTDGHARRQVQLQGLKQTPAGLWYPLMIRTTLQFGSEPSRPSIERMTHFERRAADSANPFRDDDFRYVPVFGIDIVDYRFGMMWHNDPWWADLDPITVQGLNHPDPSMPTEPPPLMPSIGWNQTDSIFGLVDPDWKAIEADWKRLAAEGKGTARIVGKVALTNTPAPDDAPEDRRIEIRAVPCLRILQANQIRQTKSIADPNRAVTVACDKSGSYAIDGLRKGTWMLSVSSRGFLTVERELVLGNDDAADGWDVTLTEDRIAGQVVDADGKPIVGADVIHRRRRRVDPLHPGVSMESRYPPVREVTNAEGQFRFDKLAEGTYWIEISASGFEPRTVEGIAAGDVTLKVLLERIK